MLIVLQLYLHLQELARVSLRQKQMREQECARINSMKIHNQWRKIMRVAKVEELRGEVEILSQNHEREVDRKDALVQVGMQKALAAVAAACRPHMGWHRGRQAVAQYAIGLSVTSKHATGRQETNVSRKQVIMPVCVCRWSSDRLVSVAPTNLVALSRLLQLLDRDLEVAEEQHQTALGTHLMVLDSLLDLQVRAAS